MAAETGSTMLGPFFAVEMTIAARRRRNFVLRILYAVGLLFFLWISYLRIFIFGGTIATSAQFAGDFFFAFVIMQQCAIFLLVPATVAGAIAQEREHRTMEYLLTTRLDSSEIVLGKLAARLLQAAILLATGFGILAAARVLGGVGSRELAHVFGGALASMFEVGAVSILISTWSRRARDALRNVYAVLALWSILPAIPFVLGGFLKFPGPVGLREAFIELAPWSVLVATITTLDTGAIARLAGIHLMLGAACGVMSIFTLRAAYRRHSVVVSRRAGRLTAGFRGNSRAGLRRKRMGSLPVWWKETSVRRGLPWTIAKHVVAAALLGATYYYSYRQGTLLLFPQVAMVMGAAVLTCALLLVTARGASSITVEKERESWPLILSTTLSDRAIILGKVGGAMHTARGWVIGSLLLWFAAALVDLRNVWGAAAQVAIFLPVCFFCAVLGVRCSLRSKSSIASMCKAAVTLLALNFAYLVLALPFISAAGLPPHAWLMSASVPLAFVGAANEVTGNQAGLPGSTPFLLIGCAFLSLFYLFAAAWMLATSIIKFDTWSARSRPRVSA